ncbi:hypothetical protein FF125_14735 [Aureibaculum algae]|uniref:Uncharacterized protein n=1 Tax=Aureibaculum algae TaxID=2584122 RepID=A0A5B7TRR1_9FLAO|nr:hypothetical protein [Aureibaculum algae]QCX39639.1 hypothetical protein FF125_14735 [Aureibaculum algae]
MSFFKKFFPYKPKMPEAFIEKFIKDAKLRHLQMELYYNERIILTIDSLKHVPIWIERGNVDTANYKNGYVVFIFFNKNKLSKNIYYQNYKLSENLEMTEYKGKLNLIYLHFFKSDTSSILILEYIKKVVDNVYKLGNKNPEIHFNLRYLN